MIGEVSCDQVAHDTFKDQIYMHNNTTDATVDDTKASPLVKSSLKKNYGEAAILFLLKHPFLKMLHFNTTKMREKNKDYKAYVELVGSTTTKRTF